MLKYIIIALILPLLVFSQDEIKLTEVNVEGNIISSKNTIIFTSGLNPGKKIKNTDFTKAIKKLWKLGLFDDVQIRYDRESEDGLSITIQVKESLIIGKVDYKGNKKISETKLEEELNLIKGQRIKPNLLHSSIEKIKELYAEKGYLNAEIRSEVNDSGEKSKLFKGKGSSITKDIIFYIDEGHKVKLKTIEFEGNTVFSDFKLRRVLKETKQQRWYLFWRSSFEKDKFEESINNLRNYYQNKGYRDFAIISDSINYSKDQKKMSIKFYIKEGLKYKYRNFTYEGNFLHNDDKLLRALGIEKGEIFNKENFDLAVYDRMQGLYMDRGFIYSRIEPQITPISKDSLDVHFIITENHKVYIRNIIIKGNEKTRENVIRRRLRIFPGDVFNKDMLLRSHREITMLNYFGNVAPDVVPIDDDEIDIELSVEEKLNGTANMNMGFSQAYGVTGGGGFSLPNWKGKGQSLALSFNVGTNIGNNLYGNSGYQASKQRSASVSFTDPMVNDSNNLLQFSIFYQFRGRSSTYYSPLDVTIQGGSIRWGKRFKWPDDYFRGSWSFQVQQRKYANEDANLLDLYTGGLDKTLGININQSISRDSRDHPEFTTIGSLMALSSTLSGGFLGGDEEYIKHVLKLEWYTPTFWKFVLLNTLKVGVIDELSTDSNKRTTVPFSDRFIMGGSGMMYGNPLRGYEDSRIGPLSSSGSPLGGNSLAKFATEFRVPFSENPVVYGMLFAEMGNVWTNKNMKEKLNLPRVGPLDMKRSVGAGIRFFMPMIGMLGFDLGYGFDDLNGDDLPEGWKTSITMGQQF